MSRNLSMRRNVVVPRTSIKLAAAVLAAGVAVSACGTVNMGAAAITGNNKISTGNLTAQVANLSSAYAADRAKGVQPQRPVGQEAQQVLTWLILFNIYNEMAAQHGITVTPAQAQQAEDRFQTVATQSGVDLNEYWSAGYALPPNLLPQLYQAAAIGNALDSQLDGGKAPKTASGQSALSSRFGHEQCLAAKDLGVSVNPQYGVYDYSGFDVVLVPPTLAADPTPSPTPSVLLTPPC
jgi:hypothetical protein